MICFHFFFSLFFFATLCLLIIIFSLKVAVAHTIGHVAATVSMSKVAVSFTHIIKSGEPAFSVLVSRFLLGETFPSSVYLSLVPIIGGCALAAVTELNFNMIGKNISFHLLKFDYLKIFCNLFIVLLRRYRGKNQTAVLISELSLHGI